MSAISSPEPAGSPQESHDARSFSIKAYLLALVLCVLVPALGFAGVALWHLGTVERERVKDQVQNEARELAAALDRDFADIVASARVLAGSESLNAGDLVAFHHRMVEAQRTLRAANISLRDANSQQIANSNVPWGAPLPSGTRVAQADARAASLGAPVVSDVFVGLSDPHPQFAVVVPLGGPVREGAPRFLSVSMPLAWVQSLLEQEVSLGPGMVASVVDQAGVFVARSLDPEHTVGRSALSRAFMVRGHAGLTEGRTAEGVPTLLAYSWSGVTGWRIAVSVSEDVLYAPQRHNLETLAIGGGVVLALLLLPALFIGRRLIGAMRMLSAAGMALARGETCPVLATPVREANEVGAVLAAASRDRSEREAVLRDREALLRTATDNGRVGLVVVGPGHRYRFVNSTYTQIMGLPTQEIVGQRVADVLGPLYEEQIRPRLERAFQGERLEYELIKPHAPGGAAAHLSVTYEPGRDQTGEPVVVVVVTDVTERKAVEAALARTAEEFRMVAEGIPTLCWMAEAGGHIYWYNKRWYEYTGTTPAAMEGWGWQSVHDPAVLPTVMEEWRASIATGAPFEMTFPLRGADGVFRPFLTRIVPLVDAEGRVRRWLGTNTDISAAMAREEDLRRSEAALQARTTELESLLTSAPLGVAFFDRAHRYLRANEALAAMNGIPAADHVGRTVAELLPASAPAMDSVIEQVFETGQPVAEFEVSGETPREPGALRHWLTGFYPVRDGSGTVAAVGAWVVEITARKRVEEALRRSEARLQTIFATAPVGIVIAEAPSGRIVAGNKQAETIFRHPILYSADVEDYRAWVSFHPDGRQVEGREYPLARALAGEERPELEVLYRRGDGTEAWVRFVAAPIRNEGRIAGAVAATLDIDRETRALQALDQARATLEARVREEVSARQEAQARLAHAQRMEALGQLAGGIAHDFNNVLQAVQGGVSLIERRPADQDGVRRLARMVFEAASRGSAITQRLLAFSRRADLRTEPIAPAPLLEGMREMLAHTLGAAIEVRVEAPPGLPALLADKGQLETVLVNLATNARDAMPDGGTLTFAATLDGDPDTRTTPYVRLSVTDTGLGMPPEVLARVTEPFFTTKPQGKGTGLGLAMARGFAEQSGGGLVVHSAPGRGTIVTLWFPVAPREAPPALANAAALQDGRRGRILLVDDDPLVRELTAEQLEAENFVVVRADSGEAALALLEAGEALDLLITDLSMPGLDGLGVIREAQKHRPHLPAILLTGFANNAAALALDGAISETFSLLRKPVTAQQLAHRAVQMLKGARASA